MLGPLAITLIGATTVGDMVAGIIASYVANQIPPITHPDFDSHAARCFEQAAEKFRVQSDVHASIFSNVSTIEEWKSYMEADGEQWVTEQLIKLWIDELLRDPVCQSLGLHVQLENVENKLQSIEKKIEENTELLNQIKSLLSQWEEKVDTKFTENPEYIKRYCADFGSNSTFLRYIGKDSEQTLLDYVIAKPEKDKPLPRVALYGGMQRGKSTELEHLAWQLQQSGSYYPVLYRLKHFRELTYDDLPKLESGMLPIVLLIDALDETSEQNFCTQLEVISHYASHHPQIRMVVSCRSNFRRSYLLKDFKSVELLPLRHLEITQYVNSHLGQESEQFIEQILANQLGDLVCQPLELKVLTESFHTTKTLPSTRVEIYRILFEGTISIETSKGVKDEMITLDEELRCLERVAVVMLKLGKRELTEDEFNQTLFSPQEKQFDHLRYGILDRSERTEEKNGVKRTLFYYSFINNAMMEYAASQLLLRCKGINELKQIACLEGTEKVSDFWFNAILLAIEQLSTKRPELISDLQTWLRADGREILIHVTDTAIISESDRGKFVIDFLEYCKSQNNHFVAYGNEWATQTRNLPLNLIQYIYEEWKNLTNINAHAQNLQLMTRIVDWRILQQRDQQLADALKQQLLDNFSNPVFDGENAQIAYNALTSEYFLNEAFTAKLFCEVSQRRHRVDYEVMTSRIAKLSDTTPYIDYLMGAEVALIPEKGTYHILPREPLYTAIYKVNTRDAILKALQVVSRETFWRWAEKGAMAQQALEILLEKAKKILESSSDKALEETLQKAKAMFDARNFVPIVRTEEEQRQSLLRLKMEVEQLCNFIYFRGTARSWLTEVEEKGPMATLDVMELYRKHALAGDKEIPNHYIIDFLTLYGNSRSDDAGFKVIPALCRRALNDEDLYRSFRMRELYRFISGEQKGIQLTPEQCQKCYGQAEKILHDLITNVRVGHYPEDTPMVLSLLLEGQISVTFTRETSRSLLFYVGIPFTRIGAASLYDDLNDDSLIKFIGKHIGEAELHDILHELVNQYCDHIGTEIDSRTMDIWTTYLISSHHKPSYILLTDKVLQCQTNLWPTWMYRLIKEKINIDMLMARGDASDVSVVYLVELCDDLISDSKNHLWIRQHLENYYDNHCEPVSQKALQLLLRVGSLHGLIFIMKEPGLFNPYINYDFSYTEPDSVPLLTQVYNLGLSRDLSPIMLNSILTSLHNIAITSEENLEIVRKEVVNSIKTLGPNSFSTQQWAERLVTAYLSHQQQRQAIPEILDKVEKLIIR